LLIRRMEYHRHKLLRKILVNYSTSNIWRVLSKNNFDLKFSRIYSVSENEIKNVPMFKKNKTLKLIMTKIVKNIFSLNVVLWRLLRKKIIFKNIYTFRENECDNWSHHNHSVFYTVPNQDLESYKTKLWNIIIII